MGDFPLITFSNRLVATTFVGTAMTASLFLMTPAATAAGSCPSGYSSVAGDCQPAKVLGTEATAGTGGTAGISGVSGIAGASGTSGSTGTLADTGTDATTQLLGLAGAGLVGAGAVSLAVARSRTRRSVAV